MEKIISALIRAAKKAMVTSYEFPGGEKVEIGEARRVVKEWEEFTVAQVIRGSGTASLPDGERVIVVREKPGRPLETLADNG